MFRPAGYSDDEHNDEDEWDVPDETRRNPNPLINGDAVTNHNQNHNQGQPWTPQEAPIASADSRSWLPVNNYNNRGNRGSSQTAAVDLRLAVETGNVEEVKRLLTSHNLDINQSLSVPGDWNSAVLAATLGHVELLVWLLGQGAKLATGNEMVTALMAVCSSCTPGRDQGLEECAALLLEKGQMINARQRQGITALMLAAKYGKIGLVRLLMAKGADKDMVDSQGWSALMFAADAGRGDVARVLLESGADTSLLSSDGQRASEIAGSNSFSVIQDLVEHYSKEKSVVLSGNDTATAKSKDQNYTSKIKKFTELENVLLGLDLHDYLEVFNNHKVGLSEFLLLTEADLIQMGIDQVGSRKKMLEGQAEIHKQAWEKPSMPRLGMEDKKVGLMLSCPDATAIMANISQHTRYLTANVGFIRAQLTNHGQRLLQVGGDLVTPSQLLDQANSCDLNLGQLRQEVNYLQKQLAQAGAGNMTAPVDMVRKGGLGSDWRWVWKLGAGLAIAGAGLGVIMRKK